MKSKIILNNVAKDFKNSDHEIYAATVADDTLKWLQSSGMTDTSHTDLDATIDKLNDYLITRFEAIYENNARFAKKVKNSSTSINCSDTASRVALDSVYMFMYHWAASWCHKCDLMNEQETTLFQEHYGVLKTN